MGLKAHRLIGCADNAQDNKVLPVLFQGSEFVIRIGGKMLFEPDGQILVALGLGGQGAEVGADELVGFVIHSPYLVGEGPIMVSRRVGKGADVLANRYSVFEIPLEFNPFGFVGISHQLIDQLHGHTRRHCVLLTAFDNKMIIEC